MLFDADAGLLDGISEAARWTGRARAGESLPAEPEACARVSAANAQRQRSSNVHLLNRGARVAQHIFTPERVMNRMS